MRYTAEQEILAAACAMITDNGDLVLGAKEVSALRDSVIAYRKRMRDPDTSARPSDAEIVSALRDEVAVHEMAARSVMADESFCVWQEARAKRLRHLVEALEAAPRAERPTADEIVNILAALDKADTKLNALCQGTEKWRMSVPARLDDDPDLVIGRALSLARQLIERVRWL